MRAHAMGLTSEWLSFNDYCKVLSGFADHGIPMYHRASWLETVASAFGVEICGVHTLGDDGTSLAITPFMCKRKGLIRLIGSPLSGMYTEFAGPVFAYGLDEANRASIVNSQIRLVSNAAHYIEWGIKDNDGSGITWSTILENWGYNYTRRPTIIVDLSSGEEAVWANFQGRARNMIRKALKAGVTAHSVIPTKTWIDEYYGMLQDTFERQGRAVPHPISFYYRLIRQSEAHFVAAEIDSRIVAAGIFLMDGPRMLYLSGTSSTEGMKTAASSLIQWFAMQKAIVAGITDYDMGGLGIASIDKFKRSFGGRETCHHRWRYRTPLFKLIEPIALWASNKGIFRLAGN